MRVLISGASKGIGKEIALRLQKEGHEAIGTSRNPSNSGAFPIVRLELSSKESIAACASKVGDVDVLINNAGISQMGPVEEIPLEKYRELFETNFFGMIGLTQAFLQQMRQRRKGFIINIGSLAGKFAVPFKSGYVSSKFALAGFTWSLRNEVMPYGIKVTVIEPTDIHTTIEPELLVRSNSEYLTNLTKVKNARSVSMAKAVGPEVVAAKVSYLLKKYTDSNKQPAPFYSVGRNGSMMAAAKRIFPDTFTEKMVKKSYGL